MSKLERFQRRKDLLQRTRAEESPLNSVESLEPPAGSSVLDEFEASQKAEWDALAAPVDVTVEQVEGILYRFSKEWEQTKFDDCFDNVQKNILSSIINPLGLGSIVAAYDKVGGNVDTIHNVRQGIYATKEEQEKYDQRGSYDSYKYHSDKQFIDVNRELSAQKKAGKLDDGYRGERFQPNAKTDLDHVVSAKEVHDDAGRVLAEMDGTSLANDKSNLTMTSPSVNRSKKDSSVDDFINRNDQKAENRKLRIQQLEGESVLNDKERKELHKLKQLDEVNVDKMQEADATSRKAMDKKINTEYYTSSKFLCNTAITGAIESGKMGMQQAMGLLFIDLFEGLFAEIKDAYAHGIQAGTDADSNTKAVLVRGERITKKIIADWQNIVTAFRDGAVSGFISNLATTLINIFATTGKNLVRIIREGMFSLFKAIKLLVFRPEGMSLRQAADAALKVLAAGAVSLGGITLDLYLQETLGPVLASIPVLGTISSTLITILAGGVTGIAMALAMYFIDKMDVFGVNDQERHRFVCEKLIALQEEADQEITAISDAAFAPLY
ncbi:hypothetical protein SDC9_16828 [bioreactor metagenome]|uniref:Uncharacterized protein n=2 Tax=root TaxID=1 RepID=A0A644TVW8_9ZZZZ|nr:hypothetical protein [Desulfovibrio desulfuricans]MCB6540557.1 hypothetical protein [Desulfovibrio desulfuricans]MCB6551639.1 hypothetical protein [Desulfovibrio desulfuricans]MCB6563482.1 hypothetical protein [Desulfovibrio desulfuricans]MCB7344929.1 hypothetical protein [Desulfovibrio desulfuricans]MCQ4860089.1 hypothetical protein [Desulfovibrio desulfuricans]